MELTVEYIPALIVAKNKEGNYIKISESNKDEIYFCPVCNGEIKARAIDSNKVQPHFYHIGESNCSNESILHWMFKNWLFEEGSIFKINNEEFKVKEFEMEKLIETPFGEYRPDLSISCDKEDFFFEINYSSGKDKTFSDKWNCLGKRVIEVNVKELINCELYDEIPTFKTIFENGEYTKEYKSYEKRDKYSEFKNFIISSKKEEQIKQIVSCYDWFWKDIQNDSEDDIKTCIGEMEYDDAVICTKFLKKIKCSDKFELCKEELFIKRQSVLNSILNNSDYSVRINKLSPQRYSISVYKYVLGTMVGEESSPIKSIDGLFVYSELKELIDECLESAKKSAENIESIVKKANEIKIDSMEFEKFITIHGVNNAKKKEYTVNLIINVYSDYFKQWIRVYNGRYEATKENNSKIKREVKSKILKKEEEEKTKIAISEKYENIKQNFYDFKEDEFYFIFNDSRKEITLKHKKYGKIKEYFSERLLNFDKDLFYLRIKEMNNIFKKAKNILDEINNCKNKFWHARSVVRFGTLIIEIKPKDMDYFDCEHLSLYEEITEQEIKNIVLKEMNRIINGRYNYIYTYKEKYMIIVDRKEN